MYFIGGEAPVPSTCITQAITNNVSVSSSTELRTWSTPQKLLTGKTNPAPAVLWSSDNKTSQILLAMESNDIYVADKYTAKYNSGFVANLVNDTEDPFLWRDKRGHWHFLNHDLVDHDFNSGARGPQVGSHLFARSWEGPWALSETIAFNTTVQYTDGTSEVLSRRERPKLYFSDDGLVTPLYLNTGVANHAYPTGSFTLIQPIGTASKEYEGGVGF
jgi:hypothetical protein